MSPQKQLRAQYDHALDRMYDLFKIGVAREAALSDALDAARDELKRVRACPSADDEIKQLCDRALSVDMPK